MSGPDRFQERFDKRREREKLRKEVVSEDEPPLPDTPVEQARGGDEPGRNDPCPCGSGKKYKKCCGAKAES